MPQIANGLRKVRVLVLGAGVAGLAAGKVLRESETEYLIIEKNSEIFGHAKSHQVGDFVFDEGPHILFGRNEKLSNFAGAPVASTFEFRARPGNIWHGHLVKHPIYLDFSSLPDLTRVEIADSLSELSLNLQSDQKPRSYEEWLDITQGSYIREKFTEIYNQKYWRTETKELDTDWLGNRVHAISIEQQEIIRSNRDSSTLHSLDLTESSYYVTKYAYSANGFQDLFPSLIDESVIRNCEVFEIDLLRQIAITSHGNFKYEKLISTIPLTEFVQISTPKPATLNGNIDKLKVTSFVCDNFVIRGSISNAHNFTWVYSYDENFLPARISFPTRLHSIEGYEGKFSLQTETYFMKDSENEPKTSATTILKYLILNGIISDDSQIEEHQKSVIKYGNIVPTIGFTDASNKIRFAYENYGVHFAGRYGCWKYFWTLESISSGIEAAKKALLGFA